MDNTSYIQVKIDLGQKHQVIDNFSASSGWSIDPICGAWTECNKNRIADLLYSEDKGIGLSCFRFYIGAGSNISDLDIIPDENFWTRTDVFLSGENSDYDWDAQAGQRWLMQAAKARGIGQFVAFTHSAPFWMNKNGHTQCDQSVGSTNLKMEYEESFAQFLADVLIHFRDAEGIDFNYISPVNEPQWSWEGSRIHEEGNRSSNEDIIRLIRKLYLQLEKKGVRTGILAPESGDLPAMLDDAYYQKYTGRADIYTAQNNAANYGGKYREYLRDFVGDPGVRQMLGNIASAHSYWTDKFEDGGIRVRRLLRENMDQYPDLKYWQTEYCLLGEGLGPVRDYGISPALWMARVIHYDLTLLNSSAWHWWLSISPLPFKDGLLYTDWKKPGDEESVITSKMLWAMGHYSKFVRPGSRRVELAGTDEVQLMGSAFISEDGGKVIAVFVNYGDRDKTIRLEILNMSKGKRISGLIPYITSDDEGNDLKQMAPLDPDKDLCHIPARSLVTLVALLEDDT